jgi:hypothetical protein
VWGVILVKVISKKHYQAQKGTAKDIYQPCERIIKDGLSSSQMHAFKIGKPCFHASMQSDFSLFMQIKLRFWSHFIVFLFFFGFSWCMVTSLRNHLNFQNSFVSDKHQHDFCFCSKLWFSKNPCENMGSCLLFWEKGKTPMNSWRNGFVSTKVCSVCYLHEHKKEKTHDFINRKGSLDKENLVEFWAKLPTKTGIGWKNQEIFAGMIKQG